VAWIATLAVQYDSGGGQNQAATCSSFLSQAANLFGNGYPRCGSLYTWMALLLYAASRTKQMDTWLKADVQSNGDRYIKEKIEALSVRDP